MSGTLYICPLLVSDLCTEINKHIINPCSRIRKNYSGAFMLPEIRYGEEHGVDLTLAVST
jgi:hypothetical protein